MPILSEPPRNGNAPVEEEIFPDRYADCTKLLKRIRRSPKGKSYVTKVCLNLMDRYGICFDEATIVSEAYFFKDRAGYSPNRNIDDVAPENVMPNCWIAAAHPDDTDPDKQRYATLGIPTQRFWKLARGLSKPVRHKKQKKHVKDGKDVGGRPTQKGRPALISLCKSLKPNMTTRGRNTYRRDETGITIADDAELLKILRDPRSDTIGMPWGLRQLIGERYRPGAKKKNRRNVEDGSGTHLVLRVMGFHTVNAKTKKYNCNREHHDMIWAGNQREEWAKMLHISVKSYDMLVDDLKNLLQRGQGKTCFKKGQKPQREALLRPRVAIISRKWDELQQFMRNE